MKEKWMVTRINSLMVGSYKVLGFGILGGILFGLVSYLAVHAFFYVSSSWVSPIIISSSDEDVIRLYGHVAEQQMSRERVLAEIRSLRIRIAEAARTVEAETRFQQRFLQAVDGDRALRSGEMARLQRILAKSTVVKEQIEESNRAFDGMARTRADELMKASLVDREEYLTVNHQLAQMARTNLSLEEASAGLEGRILELRAKVRGLESSFRATGSKGTSSIDVVLLERQYLQSVLTISKAEEEGHALRANLAAAEGNLETYDNLLRSIRDAPRVKAMEGNLTVAFVPYENLSNASRGAPVYGCALGFLFCQRVGAVVERLEGEVTTRHPVRNQILRGVLVEVEFSDASWAQRDLLHVGGRPLFL